MFAVFAKRMLFREIVIGGMNYVLRQFIWFDITASAMAFNLVFVGAEALQVKSCANFIIRLNRSQRAGLPRVESFGLVDIDRSPVFIGHVSRNFISEAKRELANQLAS